MVQLHNFSIWTIVGLIFKFTPIFTDFVAIKKLILQNSFLNMLSQGQHIFLQLFFLLSQIIRYFEIIFFELLNITIFCYIFLKVWKNNHLPYALVTYWLPFSFFNIFYLFVIFHKKVLIYLIRWTNVGLKVISRKKPIIKAFYEVFLKFKLFIDDFSFCLSV